jgi:hypothetical protein
MGIETEPVMVVHFYNPSSREAEESEGQGQAGLCSEMLSQNANKGE